MFDYHYIRDNYEYMRELILKAIALAEGEEIQRCEFLLMNCEALGLSAVHKSWYSENTDDPEKKEEFIKRYDWLRDYLMYHENYNTNDFHADADNRIHVSSGDGDSYWTVEDPEKTFSYDKTPLEWLYGGGTWRPSLDEEWVWTGSIPGWVYG